MRRNCSWILKIESVSNNLLPNTEEIGTRGMRINNFSEGLISVLPYYKPVPSQLLVYADLRHSLKKSKNGEIAKRAA